MLAYAFAFVNRVVALRAVIPGIPTKLFRISLSTIAAIGTGLLIGRVGLSFLNSLLPRVIMGGLLSAIIPGLVLLLIRADLRKWIIHGAY